MKPNDDSEESDDEPVQEDVSELLVTNDSADAESQEINAPEDTVVWLV